MEGRHGCGSGVIWKADGLIVTNAHVARGNRTRVELWDGRSFEGSVVRRDPRRDLATVQIPADHLPAAEHGDSAALRAGEIVVAVGNPLGFIGALTTGVVHSAGGPWVQAMVRLAPGNSGGPLATARGQVIGINTMVVSGGLALAVPSNAVGEFVTPRPMIGVTVQHVSEGLLVLEIAPNSPAERASLMIGDVLTSIGDATAGGLVTIRFLRGDRRVTREVTVRMAAGAQAA